jgi:hypothetical protein
MVISQSRKGKNNFLCEISMVLEKESILSISCLVYLGITQHLFKEEYENTKSINRSRMDNAMTKSKRQWNK